VDGNAGKASPLHLAFAGMNTGADLDPDALHGIARGTRALKSTCGRFEAHEETVACGVDLDALASRDLGPNRNASHLSVSV
jgi:hypothetical protein